MRFILVLILLLSWTFSFAQQVFFKTDFPLTDIQLRDFYSSFYIDENTIAFNANDYKIHAYDRKTLQERWTTSLDYKTVVPPAYYKGKFLCQEKSFVVSLDEMTGKTVDTLYIGSLLTAPMIKNDILYATGICAAGCVFAFDLAQMKELWYYFIAHGCSIKPYYLSDRIFANAEGDNWLTLDYAGKILTCQDTTSHGEEWYAPGCVSDFEFLTHDGIKVSAKQAKKVFNNEYHVIGDVYHEADKTIIDFEEGAFIYVLGKKLKKIAALNLPEIVGETDYEDSGDIVKIEGNRISFLYAWRLVTYDIARKSVIKMIDLSEYSPTNVQLVKDEIWLISKKDGMLYGLR
jgi:hypothetical protein